MWCADVLDEIALEGLDGVTLDTLWIRLQKRPGFPLNVQETAVREYLWRAVLCNANQCWHSFFVLPADRPALVWFDRFDRVSEDGTFIDESVEETTDCRAQSCVIGRSVRGFCQDIDQRQDVTCEVYANKYTLSDVVRKYGSKMVMVASQEDRNKALGLYDGDPFMILSEKLYSILELIGRRRYQGLATIGSDSAVIGVDSKTAFYCRKVLLKKGFISKTPFHMVAKGKGVVIIGSLLFLKRFYKKVMSPVEKAALKISNMLMSEADQEREYRQVREEVDVSSKKIMANIFANFAQNFECFMKESKQGNSVVKKKVIRLLKPVELDDDENQESDGEDVEDNDEEADQGIDVCDELLSKANLFDPTRMLADRTLLSPILMAIERSECGLSLVEIGNQCGLTKLDARALAKLLLRTGKVRVLKEERGRTCLSRYCAVGKVTQSETTAENGRRGLQLLKSLETAHKLKRANMILEVLDQAPNNIVFTPYTFVRAIRKNEGHGKICDAKSVVRLLQALEGLGFLRVHRFEGPTDFKSQILQVITKADIASDDPLLKERVDALLFRLNTKCSKESGIKLTPSQKRKSQRTDEKADDGLFTYNPSVGKKKYGCVAKMRKIFTLYKFLLQQMHVVNETKASSTSYGDWRHEIVPISQQNERVRIGDLVPRLPLSIFCKIFHVTYEIPGLEDLLQDPAKRNIPLNQAPDMIMKGLLFKRRYAYNILTLMTFLLEMGLVELGNVDANDKDEVTVKLLINLTFSHVDQTEKYTFECVEDVEKCEENIAMHCQSSCDGCSLPSNLFAHQTRNWYDGPRIKPMHLFPVFCPPASGMQITLVPAPPPVRPEDPNAIETANQAIRQSSQSPAPSPRKRRRTNKPVAESEDLPVNVTRKRITALDDKDKHALSILNRRRCIWSQQEDNFLLLCRVATLLLCQENLMLINGRLVRDEMHRAIPYSQNKTTNAVRRRILYMMKDHRTRQNVIDWVSEFRQDDAFSEIVVPAVPKSKERIWDAAFIDALNKVTSKFASQREDRSNEALVRIDELSLRDFELTDCLGAAGTRRMPVFVDPKNCVDIHVNAVENVLLSSLILSHEGTRIDEKYSYSLFKIYQRYPDSLIRSVVAKFKKNAIMAIRKKSAPYAPNMLKNRGLTPFKLSQHYSFLLQTKFTMDSLIKSVDLNNAFQNSEERCDAAAVVSLFTSASAKFSVAIPEDFISLDRNNPFLKSSIKVPQDILIAGDKRCSSRSVLYAFREQLSLNTKQPRDKVQDYLVLNKCSVSVQPTANFALSPLFSATTRSLVCKLVTTQVPDIPADDSLVQLIYSRKELGCSWNEIESRFPVFPTDTLNRLLNDKVIHRLGVNSFRWVHRNFLNPWIIRSASKVPSEVSEGDERRSSQHDIEYIAKIWRRPSGDPDYTILYKLMAAVVGHVLTYPGISQEAVLYYFRITAPGTQLLEILELLISAGCIHVTVMSLRPKTRLFAPISSCSLFETDESQRLYDDGRASERFFEVTPNGILILSQVREELAQRGGGSEAQE